MNWPRCGATGNVDRQAGLASVEMAIIASAFMLILMGSIEISRLMFTWNTLSAVTQRAARVAAVCPPNHNKIKQVAMFGRPDGTTQLLPNFTDVNLEITYLDETFSDTSGAFPIEFVQVRIVNYSYEVAIPFISDRLLASPSFVTTLPAESLGYIPNKGERTCYKNYSSTG